jgi:hypothetical protein
MSSRKWHVPKVLVLLRFAFFPDAGNDHLWAVGISNTMTALGYKWISRLDYHNLPAFQPRVTDL